MGPKRQDNNGCLPSFGNNFLGLFGLMVLDDEERRIRVEMDEEEDQEDEMLEVDEENDDEFDDDSDDDYDEGEDNS